METTTYRIEQIKGNTWCLDAGCSIPVYFLDDRTIVLLDSGFFDERTRPALEQFIADKQLTVRAVLTSHHHIDHTGNHILLQGKYGAELILPETEAALAHDTRMFAPVYGQMAPKEVLKHMPYMLFKADRTFPEEQETVDIDGALFRQIPLPGHTPGHTGFVTPDDVLYVADALMDEATYTRAKIPTTWDIEADLDSKKKLLAESSSHAAYILAHRGVYKDIRDLVQGNIDDRNRRTEAIKGWLSEREEWTLEDIQALLWKNLGLHTKNPLRQRIFGRNVYCVVNYLVQTGYLTPGSESGVVRYRVSEM